MASTKEQENGENLNDLNFAFGVSEKDARFERGALASRGRGQYRWQLVGQSFEPQVRTNHAE
jgi:hypothetical protein